jgi:predicted RND superfamily exporter protein
MGYLGLSLKPSTILIYSIALGIASDQTLYFLTKFRHERKSNNLTTSRIITMTLKETGMSMIYTAIILFFGFGIFSASTFGGTVALGILLSITLMVAMLCNLILLPALLLSLENKEK